MDNKKGIDNPGQPFPTDKGEDAEDRRDAAERAWKDRAGVPRGTPEEGERSADRVGGGGPAQPEPEIDNEDVERQKGRTGGTENQDEKRQASEEDSDQYSGRGQGTGPKRA